MRLRGAHRRVEGGEAWWALHSRHSRCTFRLPPGRAPEMPKFGQFALATRGGRATPTGAASTGSRVVRRSAGPTAAARGAVSLPRTLAWSPTGLRRALPRRDLGLLDGLTPRCNLRCNRARQLGEQRVRRVDVGDRRRDAGGAGQRAHVAGLIGCHHRGDDAFRAGAGGTAGAVEERLVLGRGSTWMTSAMSSTWMPRAAMSVATSTRT